MPRWGTHSAERAPLGGGADSTPPPRAQASGRSEAATENFQRVPTFENALKTFLQRPGVR